MDSTIQLLSTVKMTALGWASTAMLSMLVQLHIHNRKDQKDSYEKDHTGHDQK